MKGLIEFFTAQRNLGKAKEPRPLPVNMEGRIPSINSIEDLQRFFDGKDSPHIESFLLTDTFDLPLSVIKEEAFDAAIRRGELQAFKVDYVEVELKGKVFDTRHYNVKIHGSELEDKMESIVSNPKEMKKDYREFYYYHHNSFETKKLVSILDSCICTEQVDSFYLWLHNLGKINNIIGVNVFVHLYHRAPAMLSDLCMIKRQQILKGEFDKLREKII